MKLVKSLLLGSAAAFVATAGNAADLPSKKAAPVQYVKVCDAYGAGFFYIPGTDTCLKVGGRVRADYAYVPAGNIYKGISYAGVPTLSVGSEAQNTVGWETRGRVDLDARTQTAWGTVQTVASLRLARTTGVLADSGVQKDTDGSYLTINSNGAASTLEAAYIRFAGFTFGVARDNFSFMPSIFYGAGHWGSFANGAKQLAYTAVLGGGFSATIALQDYADTALKPVSDVGDVFYAYKSLPQVNGRLDWDQAWGTLSLSAAVANVTIADRTDGSSYDADKNVWAVGAGAKINLPMIAAGDALWLTAAYADGMTEYTTNWTSFKSSAYKRDVAGFTINHPSVVAYSTGLETVKSWNVSGIFQHYFAPQYRGTVMVGYGQLDAPTTAKSAAWNGKAFFGDASVFNVGAQFAWLPTRNFEIGVEALYARVEQDVRSATSGGNYKVYNRTDDAITGRLRVERTF